MIDLGESTPNTKQRWIDAITQLAPLKFAVEPASQLPIDRDGLTALVRDSTSAVDRVRSVLALKQEADEATRTAAYSNPKERLSRKRVRELAEAVLNGNLQQFVDMDNSIVQQVTAAVAPLRALIESQAIDKAEVLAGLFPEDEDALVSGDLSEVVRLRRQRDQARKPRDSDTPDEWHLKFAVHADVFANTLVVVLRALLRSHRSRLGPRRKRRDTGTASPSRTGCRAHRTVKRNGAASI